MRAYRDLLRVPGVAGLLFAATLPRLAYAMESLAIFFRVHQATGSVGSAGLVVGVMGGASALTAAPRGRLVDRYGQTGPLYAFVPAFAGATILLALFARSVVSAVVLAAVVGVVSPPINLSVRPLWPGLVGEERVRTAYGLDTAVINVVQLVGPVLATLISLHWSPVAAVAVVGCCMLAGGFLLAVNPHSREWVPEERVDSEPGLLRSPAMRLLAVEGALMGSAMGLVTIGLPALATLQHEPGLVGPLMSAMGVGSILGTIWAGTQADRIAPLNGLRASVLLYAVALVPLAFLPLGPVLVLAVAVSSVVVGPANVFYLETIDIVRPRGTAVTALASLWTIEGTATAIGNALGGNLSQLASPRVALALGALLAFGSPLVFTVGMRGRLRPASAAAD